MSMMTNRGFARPPSYKHAASKTPVISPNSAMPLNHAIFARVQRSPLLAECGVRLAIQRVERPHSRDRQSMQNQLATYLMIDTESGFAPPQWQDGIGDVYIYKAPAKDDGMGNLQHLDIRELGFMWDYINGELGSGECVQDASAAEYRRRLAQYRKSDED